MHLSNKWIFAGLFAFCSFTMTAQPGVQKKDSLQKSTEGNIVSSKKDSTSAKIVTRIPTNKAHPDSLSLEDHFEKQYQINILKTHLNGVYIPKDIYDSFRQLELLMGPATLREFQALPEERVARKVYLVMWIAKNWNFREGSRLSHLIRQLGITYPEHMAHFIVMTFHRHLNKKDLGIKERVEFYKEKERIAFEKAQEKAKGKVIFEETRKREGGQ